MRRVEGVNASYVGADDPNLGVRSGDRCRILSDEGGMQHVRWLTGSMAGEYGMVYSRSIVADLGGDNYDEFGFEAGYGHRSMAINIEAVHHAGGDVALLEALEAEGHLESLRYAAVEAAHSVRTSMRNDDAWHRVSEALGAEAASVQRAAIIAAFIVAVDGGELPDGVEGTDDELG